MSVSFYRNGRWVELANFTSKETAEYLDSTLNAEEKRFAIAGEPRFCSGILAEFDGVSFIIYAKDTYIELTFAKENREKMSAVIEKITKWDKFSKTEDTFYVEKAFNESYIVIFENGDATCGDFRRYFRDDDLKITKFKV